MIDERYTPIPQIRYLELRFSKGVRTAGSMTFSVQMLLYMALVLYAPSLALNAVTGFTLWGSVIAIGAVCTLYTCLGGMKAVLWTDTFQVTMMLTGLIAILIKGSIESGGIGEAWQRAVDGERVLFNDFDPNPAKRHSVWSLVIGGTFTWVAIYGVNQAMVQRCCTCSSLKQARLAIWLNFPGLCLILYLCCFIGMVMYGFYRNCDPLKFGLVQSSDQLLPLFVMDVLGTARGFPGLFVACLFSGALSTISSGLNSLSAVVLQDIIKSYFLPDISEQRATLVSKILALVFGVICLGLTYVAYFLGGVLQATLSLYGMIGGPLLGLFILGMMFPWANKWGAYAGLLFGLVFMFWIGVGAQLYPPVIPTSPISTIDCNWNLTIAPNITAASSILNSTSNAPTQEDSNPLHKLYTLSYMWYSATAVLATCVVGLIVSGITGFNDPVEADARLICPLFDILFPYLPEVIRKPMRFGVDYSTLETSSGSSNESEVKMTVSSDVKKKYQRRFDKINGIEKGRSASQDSGIEQEGSEEVDNDPRLYNQNTDSTTYTTKL
ncbi:Sodium-coupled monocarboxylate transporter 2 [Mizuhopecten yessoensis]|uniref:Sodium-coupled monocarboxylate transporter 2 n=1 Tax=Mizuhopecten yessoensis TaxID=6573 RepID=A0A210QKZ8_MIZYE|nr:Sodium-coupled monocarboxylate transporter 2 [Mizuhopecten yessoensis]